MKKAEELRDLSDNDLENLVKDLDHEIFQARNEIRMTKNVEKPHLIRQKRKEKARAITILAEKRRGS